MKTCLINIRRIAFPSHRQTSLINYQTKFSADNPTLVCKITLFCHIADYCVILRPNESVQAYNYQLPSSSSDQLKTSQLDLHATETTERVWSAPVNWGISKDNLVGSNGKKTDFQHLSRQIKIHCDHFARIEFCLAVFLNHFSNLHQFGYNSSMIKSVVVTE